MFGILQKVVVKLIDVLKVSKSIADDLEITYDLIIDVLDTVSKDLSLKRQGWINSTPSTCPCGFSVLCKWTGKALVFCDF